MKRMSLSLVLLLVFLWGTALAQSTAYKEKIFDPGPLKSIDSRVKVTAGQIAPDFTLPAIDGRTIRLSDYRGEKNVVLSFVPAAWTPVCSDQWPGYHLARGLFEDHDAVVLGISTDNTPSQFAWVRQMEGLWFPVLSDFWPHGAVAEKYGVLTDAGFTERALFVIDKQGIIRYIDHHDLNHEPDPEELFKELKKLK